MESTLHFAGISGRQGSYNTALLAEVNSLLPAGATMQGLSIDLPIAGNSAEKEWIMYCG